MESIQPRLIGLKTAAEYCGVTETQFCHWVSTNVMPQPILDVQRWDRWAIDAQLCEISRLQAPAPFLKEERLNGSVPASTPTTSAAQQAALVKTRLPLGPRVKLKGLAKVKKTLADGRTIYYCYAWRGGPLLKDKAGNPLQPGDPRLVDAFNRHHEKRNPDDEGTFAELITEFKASSAYTKLAAKTQSSYNTYLDIIREKFGTDTLVMLQDPRHRKLFKDWRDSMAAKPRTADLAWTVLARVLSVAKDNGRIAVNIAERGGRLYKADRAEKVWTDELIDKVLKVASPEVGAVMICALWTGQRKGDVLRAVWSDYDGDTIKVRQSKTGARVIIPAAAELRKVLDNLPRVSPVMMTNTYGKPWTSDGFDTSFQKARAKAGIKGLTFHDLRGTAVTRLAKASCSTAEIAAITGHSLNDVGSILDAHYLGGRADLARQAIKKLEVYHEEGDE